MPVIAATEQGSSSAERGSQSPRCVSGHRDLATCPTPTVMASERAKATSNFLDTWRIYGMGRSEERIGAVIRERGGLPAGFVLSNKLDRDPETKVFDAARARRSPRGEPHGAGARADRHTASARKPFFERFPV